MSSPLSNPAAHNVDGTNVPCAVGIDSLYISSFIDGLGIDWEMLRYEREKLRADSAVEYAKVELGGETFALKRYGAKPYSFVLVNKAFELRLGESIHPRCHVRFSSEVLWLLGLNEAWKRYNAIWDRIGCKQMRPEKIARVDAAFDFPIGKPNFTVDHFLSRAQKDCEWRESGELQSIQFGTSDIVVRVYDKVAEIEQASAKHWMFDLWGTNSGVFRIEFQIRTEALGKAGIETVEQMRAYLPGLIRHLAKAHTSLRIPNADSNRSRWPMHPLWDSLIASTDELTTAPDIPPRPFQRGSLYSIERQLQSMMGDMKGLAATLSRNCPDRPVTLEQLMQWLPRMMRRHHSPLLWDPDVREKIRRRELGL